MQILALNHLSLKKLIIFKKITSTLSGSNTVFFNNNWNNDLADEVPQFPQNFIKWKTFFVQIHFIIFWLIKELHIRVTISNKIHTHALKYITKSQNIIKHI